MDREIHLKIQLKYLYKKTNKINRRWLRMRKWKKKIAKINRQMNKMMIKCRLEQRKIINNKAKKAVKW